MGLLEEASPRTEDLRRDAMKAPDDVSVMIRLKALGWGSKRITAELGCSRNTVWRWVAAGDWRPCRSPSWSKKLDGLTDWLAERFRRHAGNADVVRQELAREKGIVVSLRTIERAVTNTVASRTTTPRAAACKVADAMGHFSPAAVSSLFKAYHAGRGDGCNLRRMSKIAIS